MASNTPIYKAYVGIIPTAKGFGKSLEGELQNADLQGAANKAGDRAGRTLGSRLTGAFKGALKIGAVAAGAVTAMTVVGGFSRALGIEDAQAKMRGLGHDTGTVEKIMNNALASVEGTSYGLDAAATTAAGAVAAGIKPGQELEGVLTTIANAAAASGGTMDEMGSIFNTVAAVGRAYTGDIQMLAQRGIPIWQSLSTTLGVTEDEARKMATEGKISFEMFEEAARHASGDVAESMGNTTRGALANMMTSFSKLGAMFVTGILPLAKTTFGGIQSLVAAVTAKLEPFVEAFFGRFGGGAEAGIESFFEMLVSYVEEFNPEVLMSFFRRIEDFFRNLDYSSFENFFESVSNVDLSQIFGGSGGGVINDLLSSFSVLIGEIAKAAPGLAATGVDILAAVLGYLADNMGIILKLLPTILAGIATWTVATRLFNSVSQLSLAIDVASLPVQIKRNITAIESARTRAIASTQELRLIAAKRGNVIATEHLTLAETKQTVATRTGNVAKTQSTVATTRETVAQRANTIATNIGAKAKRLASGAARMFGAALRFALGPIGLIIIGITALVGGLIWFFTKTEQGSKIWAKIWGGIQKVVAGVVGFFTDTVFPIFRSMWDLLMSGDYTGGLGGEDSGIVNLILTIRDGAMAVVDWFQNTLIPSFQSIYSILVKGDYVGGLGGEDSGVVAYLFLIRETAEVIVGWITNTLVPTFSAAARALFKGDASGGGALASGSPVIGFLTGIYKVATAVVGWLVSVAVPFITGVLIPVIIGAIAWVADKVFWLYANVFKVAFTAIGVVMKVAWVIIDTFFKILVFAITKVIAPAAMWLWQNVMVPVWNGISTVVGAVIGWIVNSLVPFLVAAWNVIADTAVWLYENIIKPVWKGIRIALAIVVTAILLYVDMIVWAWRNILAPVATWLYEAIILPVWNAIKGAIKTVVDWAMNTAWPALKATFEWIGDIAVWLYENVMLPVWEAIKGAIKAVVDWFQNTAWPALETVIGWIQMSFEGWKLIIQGIWNFVKDRVINPVVQWFRNTVWPLIDTVIGWIEMSFEGWKLILQAIWNFVKNRIINPVVTWFRDTVWPMFRTVIGSIRDRFVWFRDRLKAVWDFIKDRTIAPIANWFRDKVKPLFDNATGGIEDAFSGMRDVVEEVWNKIKETAKEPVEFVVNKIINDAIIGTYNDVAKGIFGLDEIDDVSLPAGWRKGGILPGFTPMSYGDDVLTPMRSGEGVLVSEGLRDKASRSLFLAANWAAKKGRSFAEFFNEGYAKGGLVKLGMPFRGNYPRGDGFGARGGRHKGIDWPMPSGTSLLAVAGGTANRSWNPAAGNKLNLNIGNGLVAGYHHLASYIAGRGASVNPGQAIARVGSTGRSSGPHLHFSLKKDGTYVNPAPYLGAGGEAGSGEGGGWWNPFSGLWNSLKQKVRDGVGDHAWGDMLFEVPKKILDGAVTWATDKLSSVFDFGSDDGGSNVQQWSSLASRALRMKGQYSSANLSAMLRRMDQESSGNARAINNWDSNARRGTPSKGLMQVIQPTFDRHKEPGYGNIWAPLHNMLASINYTLAAYPSLQAGWNRKGGYAGGGIVGQMLKQLNPTLMDTGGYLMPGVNTILNKTGGYETVIPRAESEMLRAMSADWKTNGAEKAQYIYAPNQVDMDETVERRTRREFEMFVDLAKKASR